MLGAAQIKRFKTCRPWGSWPSPRLIVYASPQRRHRTSRSSFNSFVQNVYWFWKEISHDNVLFGFFFRTRVLKSKSCLSLNPVESSLCFCESAEVRDTLTSWLGRLWHDELEAGVSYRRPKQKTKHRMCHRWLTLKTPSKCVFLCFCSIEMRSVF